MEQQFLVSSADLGPTTLSVAEVLDRLTDGSSLPEAIVHPPVLDFPRLEIEFHPNVGFSILCFEDESSVGYLAAVAPSTSAPEVPVNLGGQVVEKWPRELFLEREDAVAVIEHFFACGQQHPKLAWVRLDAFQREELHHGPGLYEFWQEISAPPSG